jgi:hypothetical protein
VHRQATVACDKKLANVTLKSSTESIGSLFFTGQKSIKLSMPTISEAGDDRN